MKVLVIIPAYNESENIVNTVTTLLNTCPGVDYVVVNDCSTDDTAFICEKKGFNYVSLPVNLGIGGAMQTGFLYARDHGYDAAVQFDGDGQHNAKYIPALVEEIEKGADLVIGSRFINRKGFQSSGMRRAGIKMLGHLLEMCGAGNITDATSGFRAVSKRVIAFFAENYAQDYPEPEAIMAVAASGMKIKEIPVTMNERRGGVSSINAARSVYYMIKVTLAVLIYRMVGKRWK